ncbi:peptidoglycan-binding protein [Xanthobacter dioxanivorans]|uniref:Peptidoglycan-binding protein n=1 Tax=Xanthobacter dioxanivorans TaxID=2528964 RepID=A0A974PNC4_9HYPH|nr:peptidoglycan-binding domain-containing protein [Xanthobacter dioxanivorans]QRG06364.1 peptidoglycan-binding protein [Xanthobacter dioxanivorans]
MRLEPVLQASTQDVAAELPPADEAEREGRRLRRLDFVAGAVALAASGGFLVNALLLQAPPPGAPLPEARPAGAIQALDRAKASRTTVPLPPANPMAGTVPSGGATNGSLGYLSVRTTTAEAPVPLVPATPGPGLTRTDHRADSVRRPLAALGTAPDVTGTLRPPGEVPASPRILSVQKALAKLGYGPLKVDGLPGGETRSAVLRFQRDRNLTADGEVSDRLVRELAAVSGMPVN